MRLKSIWLKRTVLKGLNLLFFFSVFLSLFYCHNENIQVLIEAESFENQGGWVVDPQFVEQMGSPYLLAHGLGIPVDNATTKIDFQHQGIFYVWARTKNWIPGDWPAPGRFRISVNQVQMENVLGTNPRWEWQYAGTVEINKPKLTIELIDLTGFEGRCDAIYLSTAKKAPPGNKTRLKKWREDLKNPEGIITVHDEFDVVVVGGGIAGCAAAIASVEQGLKVALIHDRPILGGNASSEIRVHTEGIPWQSERIISMINTVHWPNGSPLAIADDKKRHENISKYDNLHIFLKWRASNAVSISGVIKSVDARHTETGHKKRFLSPLFIDCTGDGWIGYWAGAETMYGRENFEEYNEAWEKYGELWSPQKNDNRVMGSSVLWRSLDTNDKVEFPEVPWAMDVSGDYAAVNGTWKWEFISEEYHQIDDAEHIRDHFFRAIYGSFYNAKQRPENSNRKLKWISYLLGKRESRRLVGDYIYTFNDVREMREFPDAVVMEKRPVDVHYQQNRKNPDKPDYLSEAMFYKVDHYYIPFRCLYSKDIENLLMAGRCFSCSHIGLGGPRVMHTTGQMGVAVGYAAALCKKYDTNPRTIYLEHIAELKNMISSF